MLKTPPAGRTSVTRETTQTNFPLLIFPTTCQVLNLNLRPPLLPSLHSSNPVFQSSHRHLSILNSITGPSSFTGNVRCPLPSLIAINVPYGVGIAILVIPGPFRRPGQNSILERLVSSRKCPIHLADLFPYQVFSFSQFELASQNISGLLLTFSFFFWAFCQLYLHHPLTLLTFTSASLVTGTSSFRVIPRAFLFYLSLPFNLEVSSSWSSISSPLPFFTSFNVSLAPNILPSSPLTSFMSHHLLQPRLLFCVTFFLDF
jgi:hypothetical protein